MGGQPLPPPHKHAPTSRQGYSTPAQSRVAISASAPPNRGASNSRDATREKTPRDVSGLKDYTLGDCLGKGAFGSVYRALNWGTGETVAIKQVKLADLPTTELRVIMLEIDLLKNLNHPNIVKYHGFKKTSESLYIILEYCENGSLHSICKNFGKFPENLLALYMAQVLHGLLYLHDQGVIHRDIKGANILTTKEGLVKLADFGVATKATGLSESSVVGTPYWMAPEVIELSGATTASDIWSLGCTVIELLDGKPPYHKLQPMPALFRIVNDDHPPLPEGASPAVRDFLMQCFQKDPNLRVPANKLLKHPWIISAKRSDSVLLTKPYEEAVKSVQQWNEALKSSNNGTIRLASKPGRASPQLAHREPGPRQLPSAPKRVGLTSPKLHSDAASCRPPDIETGDNWDDDFTSAISPSALELPHLKPHDNFAGLLSAEKLKAYATFESLSDDSKFDSAKITRLSRRNPPLPIQPDPLETVRPSQQTKANMSLPKNNVTSPKKHPTNPESQILRSIANVPASKTKAAAVARPPNWYRENLLEDYSDLASPDDSTFQRKAHQMKGEHATISPTPKSPNISDPRTAPSKAGMNSRRSPEPGHATQSINQALSSRHNRSPSRGRASDMKTIKQSAEIQKYAEDAHDEDFSDIFSHVASSLTKADGERLSERDSSSTMNMISSKLSAGSWTRGFHLAQPEKLVGDLRRHDDDDDEEDDPFALLEEGFDEIDLETNVARDRYARLCTMVEGLVCSLNTSQPDDVLSELSDQLMQVLLEFPEIKTVIISSHGMLPILEILDVCERRDVILCLLKVVNMIITGNVEIQENLCFVGGIPIISKFAHKKYSSEIRLEAAVFVRQMYQASTLTLQMFISCGGLNVLVEFLEEDLDTERDLVLIGVTGVWSVFELQGPTPKNDFCRIFSRSSVLYPLSLVLNRVLDEDGELADLIEGRIVSIFLLFSQAENHVKEIVADRMVLKRVLKDLRRMSPKHQITMLKFIKNLSMLPTTHDSLQNSNAIEVLTDLLSSSMKSTHFREVSNQVLNIMYNLCRLSKTRQEDAALNGVIPLLQHIVQTEWPLKEFALPILCDMAHSGKVGRKILWQNKGLQFYISLLADRYWQVTALDAIFIWLQEETAKVEEHLLDGSFGKAIVDCFTNPDTSADAFENLLEPLQKLLRLSPLVAASLARPEIFARAAQKLNTKKAVVRLNLLRIIRSICDASEEQCTLIRIYGLYESVLRLAEHDQAILVREMASELVKFSEPEIRRGVDGARNRSTPRRSSVSTMTPPALISSQQLPPTPSHARPTTQPSSFIDKAIESTRAHGNHGSGFAYRPASRDSSASSGGGGSGGWGSGSASASRSRLPRTNLARFGRLGGAGPKEDDNLSPTPTPGSVQASPRPGIPLNHRRRRQTSSGFEGSRFT